MSYLTDKEFKHNTLVDMYKHGYIHLFNRKRVDEIDATYDEMIQVLNAIQASARSSRVYEFHTEYTTTKNVLYVITITSICIEKETSGIKINPKTENDKKRWEKHFIDNHIYISCENKTSQINNIVLDILSEE